jgi:replicative DNA helicase
VTVKGDQTFATLPHSIDAEQAVLGGLFLHPKSWTRIATLRAEHFYRPDHRLIFTAIIDFASNGRGFDTVIIEEELKRRRQLEAVGGLAYLITLQRDTPGVANLEIYADTIRGYALQRRLLSLGEQLIRDAVTPGESGVEILARTQETLIAMRAASRVGGGLVDSPTTAAKVIENMDNQSERHHGLHIGLKDFDQLTCGIEPGDLTVFAARPAVGKTSLLVTIASHVSLTHTVGVFSAEMPSLQLVRRCVALLSNVSQGKLRRADQLTDEDWVAITPAAAQFAERRLWIDETSSPSLSHIRAECLSLKARAGLGLVLVDYLQLIRGDGANRYEQMRDVAYGLKALAKDLNVPVIALAQLNRQVESRESKRGNASDVRDSGAIEEACDLLGMLYSHATYDADFSMPDVIECNIVKHRNGERGQCLWSLDGAHSRVTVLDAGDRAQYRKLVGEQRGFDHRASNAP